MTKLDAILEKMPTSQRRQVEEFAAQLLQSTPIEAATDTDEPKPNRIQFDALERLFARSRLNDGDTRDDERKTLDAWADAAED